MSIDLRAWDTNQHDKRVLADGSINVDPDELLDLKARLRKTEPYPDASGIEVIESVRNAHD